MPLAMEAEAEALRSVGQPPGAAIGREAIGQAAIGQASVGQAAGAETALPRDRRASTGFWPRQAMWSRRVAPTAGRRRSLSDSEG